MSARHSLFVCPLIFMLLACCSIGMGQTPIITVTIEPVCSVGDKSVITVGDIATIRGGVPATRQKVVELDVDALDSKSTHFEISKRQLELRLLLAGLGRDQFRIDGPSAMQITRTRTHSLQNQLESMLGREIARQFGLEPDAVAVQLINRQQVDSAVSQIRNRSFEVMVVTQPQLPVGRSNMKVEFLTDKGYRFMATLDAQVIITREVALATRSIERGTVIQEDMFRLIKRPIMTREDFASPDQLIGRVSTRRIPSNDVLLASHLVQQSKSDRWDVKTNELLDVIILVGGSQIRLTNAKALNSANRGENVLVLNTRSNKRFTAKVVDKHLAQVQIYSGVNR